MTCAWAERVRLFVDDELEPAAQQDVAAHLAGCVECTAAVAEQLALKKLVPYVGESLQRAARAPRRSVQANASALSYGMVGVVGDRCRLPPARLCPGLVSLPKGTEQRSVHR